MRIALKDCKRHKFLFCIGLSVISAFFLITACATSPKQAPRPSPKSEHTQVANRHFSEAKSEKRIRTEFSQWQGTRHRWGGTDSRGIDCSGFVKAVYKDVFNIDLPRTTKLQVKQGRPVSFKELQAGDLVFFKPPTYPRHVGIFLSDSEFVHASKKDGVTLSKIDKHYWGKYLWTARRILSDFKHP